MFFFFSEKNGTIFVIHWMIFEISRRRTPKSVKKRFNPKQEQKMANKNFGVAVQTTELQINVTDNLGIEHKYTISETSVLLVENQKNYLPSPPKKKKYELFENQEKEERAALFFFIAGFICPASWMIFYFMLCHFKSEKSLFYLELSAVMLFLYPLFAFVIIAPLAIA